MSGVQSNIAAAAADNTIPLVVHLIYRLDFGGLENLMVERINRMPANRYRHAVVCLTGYTDFSRKITKPGVALYALDKQPGLSLATHVRLWNLLRQLKPTVLHAYNLSAIEYAPVALLAGVPVRISGSHGRDASDPDGTNPKHNFLRRAMRPFYDCCYSNSADLLAWNRAVIGVTDAKSCLLANGIDTDRFQPRGGEAPFAPLVPTPSASPFTAGQFIIGSVGRVQDVKDHASLVDAFILLRQQMPAFAEHLRLAVIGDGPLLPALKTKVAATGLTDLVWLPGARNDVAELLRGFSVFALPSIAEGTPGSALEAMATGLPVVGTRVGGIPEVIDDGVTGTVVPPSDPQAMATAIGRYCSDPVLAARHGAAGRQRVLQKYNMAAMIAAYMALYDALCDDKNCLREPSKSCAE